MCDIAKRQHSVERAPQQEIIEVRVKDSNVNREGLQ
jgi:hypothetical protein